MVWDSKWSDKTLLTEIPFDREAFGMFLAKKTQFFVLPMEEFGGKLFVIKGANKSPLKSRICLANNTSAKPKVYVGFMRVT